VGAACTRRTGIALSAALGLTSVSTAAFAQDPSLPSTAPLENAPPEAPLPRSRAGVGGFGGGSSFYNGNFNGNVDVAGLYVRGGLQWSHAFGTEIEGGAGSSLLTSSVHAGLFFNFALLDGFSFAIGPVVGANHPLVSSGAVQCLGCQAPSNETTVTYVAGAARFDFLLLRHRNANGARGLDLGVEVQVGDATDRVPAGESSLGLGIYFMIGYAAY